MAVVTSDYLAGVLQNFRALFNTDFQAASNVQGWREIAVSVDSNGFENVYTWFGTVPEMRNVTHSQAAREGLFSFNFAITNEEWQMILEVERAALERDQLNLIRPRIQQLGMSAASHPGRLILSLFNAPGNAFDNVAFFSDTRVIGRSANIDNIVTGTGVTIAAIQADLNTARGVMRSFQDDQGRPMNLVPNVLVVPPGLELVFFQALNVSSAGTLDRAVVPSAQGGTFGGAGYLVIPNPYLTDATDWYMLHCADALHRPFVYQEEVPPRLEGGTDPQDQSVIESRKFIYSVYGRYNVGVTDPRFAVRVTEPG